ncbi:MAG TPA: hypothetical protein VFD26_06235 [Methyloceanibacter sp.]|nr:hypothetical protein [Methyloceanibacter sp.]
MNVRSDIVPAVLAVILGAADWELTRQIVHRREAWDDPLYWQLGYPVLLLAAFLMGMVWRDRPWRWVVGLIAGPAGLIMFALLALPCLLAAYVGRWIGERALT